MHPRFRAGRNWISRDSGFLAGGAGIERCKGRDLPKLRCGFGILQVQSVRCLPDEMRTNQRVWPSRRRALCKRLDFSVQCCLFVQYDAVMSIDQIAFALPAALAVWLSQSRSAALRRWACLFGLGGMPYWIYSALSAGRWGMLALACVFALGWLWGLWVHWLTPRRRVAMDSGLGTIQITPGTR